MQGARWRAQAMMQSRCFRLYLSQHLARMYYSDAKVQYVQIYIMHCVCFWKASHLPLEVLGPVGVDLRLRRKRIGHLRHACGSRQKQDEE